MPRKRKSKRLGREQKKVKITTFFDANLLVRSIDDTYSTFDNELWDAFNHFRKEEQAKEAAKRVKEILRKFHEEIGE